MLTRSDIMAATIGNYFDSDDIDPRRITSTQWRDMGNDLAWQTVAYARHAATTANLYASIAHTFGLAADGDADAIAHVVTMVGRN